MAEKYICVICQKTKNDLESLPTFSGKDKDNITVQKNYKKMLINETIINTHLCCGHKMTLISEVYRGIYA